MIDNRPFDYTKQQAYEAHYSNEVKEQKQSSNLS